MTEGTELLDTADLDLTSDDRLFGPGRGHWSETAMVPSTTTAHLALAMCFKEAGDALMERGVQTHTQDLLLFPALFSYRHAVELALKDIIYTGPGHEQLGRPPVWRGHALRPLWIRARQVIEAVWPDGDADQLDHIEAVVGELADIDPDSHHLRYDRGTDGYPRAVPEQLRRVDTSRARETMYRVFGLLQGAADGISELNAAAE